MGVALSGVRVIDISRMLAGPYGSMLLADLGAEVIKIEEPARGDPTRYQPPYSVDGISAYFIAINRNKKSVTLDLTRPEGRAILNDLVRQSDVVYDNLRPDALQKIGCDYETLRKVNPRIIACSITGFGSTGPDREKPAYDLTLQALSGEMSITGEAGRPPVRMGVPLGDLAGGMFAAYAVAAALYRREQTGVGERIDLSLLDCQISLLTYVAQYYLIGGLVPGPIGSGHQSIVPYQAFQTADIWIVIAVYVEKFWQRLCQVIDRPELADDPRFADNAQRVARREEVTALLQETFRTRSGTAWLHLLEEADIPCAPINTLDRALANPQVLHREMITNVAFPTATDRLPVLGNPIKMSDDSEARTAPPPRLGEHTFTILSEILRLSGEEIDRLRDKGIV